MARWHRQRNISMKQALLDLSEMLRFLAIRIVHETKIADDVNARVKWALPHLLGKNLMS